MFTPLLLMLSGIVSGYLGRCAARRWRWPALCLRLCAQAIPPAVPFLLFLLGAGVGGDAALLRMLPRLGGVALWLTLCGLAGSFVCVRLIRAYLPPVPDAPASVPPSRGEAAREPLARRLMAMATGSVGIITFFCLGLVLARAAVLPPALTSHMSALYALYALMALVGVSLGRDERLGDILRTLRPWTLLLPLATGCGTLLGSALASLAVSYGLADCLAVGSGFVYYSLSSVIISMSKGPELGAIALMANIARELLTFVAAPLIVRLLGPECLISCGGASTMDSTLPTVARHAGVQWTFVSIVHAMPLDFSVPFLVPFFCSL